MSWYYEPSRPIETDKGIKARSKRGSFARNWWASRWTEALNRIGHGGRLQRGRRYARSGQVLSIEDGANGISARVQGSQRQPYTVTIGLQPLSDAQWSAIFDQLSQRALLVAQLLTGEMPPEIEDVFAQCGVSLFPDRPSELLTHCSCPDSAVICKHIAATHYILAERFDEDPFLLLRMRGRTQQQIMSGLRQFTTEADDEMERAYEPPEPLDHFLNNYFSLQASLQDFSIKPQPAPLAQPLLQRLGQPPFLTEDLQRLLQPAYAAAGSRALELAFAVEENETEPAK